MKEKKIADKVALEMLNCSACSSVVNAIKIKQWETKRCSLYQAYEFVADKYKISFGIDVEVPKFYPYVSIDNKIVELDEQDTMLDAQKEILHQTMDELAKKNYNNKNNYQFRELFKKNILYLQ